MAIAITASHIESLMFKRLTDRLRTPGSRYLDRVSIEYGEILSTSNCEAILFFMQPNLHWGGILNHALLKKAGPGLDEHVLNHVISPKSGDVFALPGFASGYKAMFLAVLADWDGGNGFEERDLMNCYRGAVGQAQALGVKNLAIPALGRDKRDFPHIRFARLALRGILEKLDGRLDAVKILCIDRTMMATYTGQLEKMKNKA